MTEQIGPSTANSALPGFEAELRAMQRVAAAMQGAPRDILQMCAEVSRDLCGGGTAGVSISGADTARTGSAVIAGALDAPPNGLCLDSEKPALLEQPDFDAVPPVYQTLVVPLAGNTLRGAIWVASHDPAYLFTVAHMRVMQRIAVFTASALQMALIAEQAQRRATEKAAAFSELDHRISNTLQMVASMLQLQQSGIADSEARAALDIARRRIITIGKAHRTDTGPEGNGLAALVRSVCDDAAALHPGVHVEIDAPENVAVPGGGAVVVALIVNELVSNAVKHAFPGGQAGIVNISLRHTGPAEAALRVSDNGQALASRGGRTGIGIKLVRGLARQLGGEFTMEPEAKRFTVRFPVAKKMDLEESRPAA